MIGASEAKPITALLDAPGVSVVATKEISCSQKPNMLIFSIIPVHADEQKNQNYVSSVQQFVSAFTNTQMRICLFFVQLKPESSLTDSPAYKFNGESVQPFSFSPKRAKGSRRLCVCS